MNAQADRVGKSAALMLNHVIRHYENRLAAQADEIGRQVRLAGHWRARAQCMTCAERLLGVRGPCPSHGAQEVEG